MSHAIRIRMSEPNAPADALDRINTVRDANRPILGPDTDDERDQETRWQLVDGEEVIEPHYVSVIRFDERDDVDAIVDEIHNNQFPSVSWYVIHTHHCTHEYQLASYRDDSDYPDGSHQPCDWGNAVRERGNVPSEFL